MLPEDRERLVRVEVSITTLTKLFIDYMEKPCIERGCSLNNDVVSLKSTQKVLRQTVWLCVGAALTSGIAFCVTNLIGG
jgi:hypothetical protein